MSGNSVTVKLLINVVLFPNVVYNRASSVKTFQFCLLTLIDFTFVCRLLATYIVFNIETIYVYGAMCSGELMSTVLDNALRSVR